MRAWKHGAQQVVGYAYLHRDQDVTTASTATYGLRWTGERLHLKGCGWPEAAHQAGHGNNPQDFSHCYWLRRAAYSVRGIAFKVGWEHLGGNGSDGAVHPLATLHVFNRLARATPATPPGGLERSLSPPPSANSARSATTICLDRGLARLPGRYRVGGHWPLRQRVECLAVRLATPCRWPLKIADYRADRHARAHHRKRCLQVEWATATPAGGAYTGLDPDQCDAGLRGR